MTYKPDRYSSVSPYLIVDGAAATSKLRHAEVRIDDTVIMVADPVPPDWPAIPANVHVYVKDVDATYRRALEAGHVWGPVYLLLRAPLQLAILFWVWRFTLRSGPIAGDLAVDRA